jgi:DNA polymerase-3 subunit alpha
MKYFTYNCGCKFPIVDSNSIIFNSKIEDINLDCQRTWELISEGNTKGCFQLESRLGRTMAKKLKPENIEQLSALISIVRPGCLEAIRDGKSVSNHYIDKKNGNESIDYFHPSLEPILNASYGEMIYQEQAMEITKVIAGFNLQEADMLRKAIGKKQPEEMAKVKQKFLEGATSKNIVNQTQAEEIFSWIEKSQRYSFNKSHSISYAVNAYMSAYAKAHFPKIFFASYLRYAKDKIDPQQEIKELIQNANEMDIEVTPPDIRNLNEFFSLQEGKIYFGLTDIKGVGKSVFDKLKSVVTENNLDLNTMTWEEILFKVLLNINSTAAKALISCGALRFVDKTRNAMLYELNIASKLTSREIKIIEEYIKSNNLKNLIEILSSSKVNKKRMQTIQELKYSLIKPPFSLADSPEWISDNEDTLLGYSITCSKIDMYDISMTNCTCKEFKNGFNRENIMLAGEIDRIHVVKTKNGNSKGMDMAFISVSDSTGNLDSIICFAEQYRQFKNVLFDGNVIIIKGKKSNQKDSLIVEKIFIPAS